LRYFASEGDDGRAFQSPLTFRALFVNDLVHVAAVIMLHVPSGYSIGLDAHPLDGEAHNICNDGVSGLVVRDCLTVFNHVYSSDPVWCVSGLTVLRLPVPHP
jgi:hypothetical protein